MKRFMLGIVLGIGLIVGAGIGYALALPTDRVSPTLRNQCKLARMDAGWVIREMLSDGRLDREVGRGIYDRVLLEQRVCNLFTAPSVVACADDGCRAATMASAQLVMP